jgi:hypothetical protein
MRRRIGRKNERGATLVEAAIATPLVFMLLFLVFEGGFMMRASTVARYGATSGARAGSIAGNDASADYDVLAAVRRSANAMKSSREVVRVVIYKASGPGDKVPNQCLAGPVNNLCNVYAGVDLDRPQESFTSGTWTPAMHWDATTRSVSRLAGSDWLGVYVTCDAGQVLPGFPTQLSSGSVSRLQSMAG